MHAVPVANENPNIHIEYDTIISGSMLRSAACEEVVTAAKKNAVASKMQAEEPPTMIFHTLYVAADPTNSPMAPAHIIDEIRRSSPSSNITLTFG